MGPGGGATFHFEVTIVEDFYYIDAVKRFDFHSWELLKYLLYR